MKKDFKKISDISTVDVLKDSGIENLTNGSGSDGSGSDGSGSDGSGSDGSGSDGSGSDGSGSDGSGSDGSGSDGSGSDGSGSDGSGSDGSGSDGSGSDGSGSDGSGSDGSGSDGSGSDGSGSDGSGSDSGSGSDTNQVKRDYWSPDGSTDYGPYRYNVHLNINYDFTIETGDKFCFKKINALLWIKGDDKSDYKAADQNIPLSFPTGGDWIYVNDSIELYSPSPKIVDSNGNEIVLRLYYRIDFNPKDGTKIFDYYIR